MVDISKLKEQGSRLDFYVSEILTQNPETREDEYPTHRDLRLRTIDALQHIGNEELARTIKDCQPKKRCESMWCKTCRQSIADSYYDTLSRHTKNYGTHNNDYRHVTALIGLCDLSVASVNQLLKEKINAS